MFNPYYGLFEYSATDNYTLQVTYLSLFSYLSIYHLFIYPYIYLYRAPRLCGYLDIRAFHNLYADFWIMRKSVYPHKFGARFSKKGHFRPVFKSNDLNIHFLSYTYLNPWQKLISDVYLFRLFFGQIRAQEFCPKGKS